MAPQTIEVEGETLEEARASLKSRFPEGLFFISEKVISDGTPKTARGVAETVEAAFKQAQDGIPDGAAILGKQEITAPGQKSVTVEGLDEKRARENLAAQIPDTAVIKAIRLTAQGEKKMLGLRRTPNQYEAEVCQQAVIEITYRAKAKISAEVRERKEEVIELAMSLFSAMTSLTWPNDLERDIFDKVDFEKLLARLKNYQEMPHPGSSGIYPSFAFDNQRVGREKNPAEDFKLVKKAACIENREKLGPHDEKTSDYAFAVISSYSKTALAWFLLMLPIADRIKSGAGGEAAFFVGEIEIDILKGVENLLFEICQELEDGQLFTDETVKKKFLSIVESAKK